MTLATPLAVALRNAARGFLVFPTQKAPDGKKSGYKGWQKLARLQTQTKSAWLFRIPH